MNDLVQLMEKLWDKSDLNRSITVKLLINLKEALVSFNLDLIEAISQKNHTNTKTEGNKYKAHIIVVKQRMMIYLGLWNIHVQQGAVNISSVKHSLKIALSIDYKILRKTLKYYRKRPASVYHSDAESCIQLFKNVLN